MTLRCKRRWPGLATLALALWGTSAGGDTLPSLHATAHEYRERISATFSVIPLWDTTWWIEVSGARGSTPLAGVEYHARFTDSTDTRTITGNLELGSEDRDGFAGRITVTCPVRPDYTRPLRVRLRLRDASGANSEWVEALFPVRGEHATKRVAAADTVPLTTEPVAERQHEIVGTVEIEVSNETTIADVRSALQEKARSQGGDAAVGFRLVSNTDDRNTFAADVIRSLDPSPAPTSAAPAPPESGAPAGRVLGEIAVRHTRQ